MPAFPRVLAAFPLLLAAGCASRDGRTDEPPAGTVRLNIGIAQREEGPAGSLVRVIPVWTSRRDRVYDSRDWLVWPLVTGHSRWTDTSEFFSLPILAYAVSGAYEPHRSLLAPAATVLTLPVACTSADACVPIEAQFIVVRSAVDEAAR